MRFLSRDITQYASTAIIQRGRLYKNRVSRDKVKLSPGKIETIVYGTKPYTTSISKSRSGYFDECSCPYGATCKHTVALAYCIEENPFWRMVLDGQDAAAPFLEQQSSSGLNWLKKTRRQIVSQTVAKEKKQLLTKNHLGLAYFISAQIPERDSWIDGTEALEAPLLSIEVYRYTKLKNGRLQFNKRPYDPSQILQRQPEVLHKEIDYEILRLMKAMKFGRHYWSSRTEPTVIEQVIFEKAWLLLTQSAYVFWKDDAGNHFPLKLKNIQPYFFIQGKMEADDLVWEKQLVFNQQKIDEEIQHVFGYQPLVILTNRGHLYQLKNSDSLELLTAFSNAQPVTKSELANPQILQELFFISRHGTLRLPESWFTQAKLIEPTPLLLLDQRANAWRLEPSFRYGKTEYQSLSVEDRTEYSEIITLDDDEKRNQENKELIFARRDFKKEDALLEELSDKFHLPSVSLYPIEVEMGEFSIIDILRSLSNPWEVWVQGDKKPVTRSIGELDLESTSGIDWLDISGDITFDDQKIHLAEVMDELMNENQMLQVKGKRFLLSDDQYQQLKKLSRLYDRDKRSVRLHRTHLGMLEDLDEFIDHDSLHQQWRQSLTAFRNFTGIKKAPLAKKFTAELRDYQQAGVNWLHFLRESGFGGILADDMGLGKTIQALALLAHAHEHLDQDSNQVSLIIAPTSVVYNWQQEINRFAPEMRTHIFMGLDRQLPVGNQVDIILTSYALLWRDQEKLRQLKLHYLVLDESQYIKNAKSKTFKAACSLEANHRLSLTGTPLENNLTELWAQFQFVNQGMFGSQLDFKDRFQNAIEKQKDEVALEHLKKIIKPFLLRRTKQAVLKDLPEKVEEIRWCQMEDSQAALYEAVKSYYQVKVFELLKDKGIERSQFEILEALLRLRQICCHPGLLKLESKKSKFKLPKKLQKVKSSVKTEAVVSLIEDIVAQGHKVLVFSQFTSMLDILSQEMRAKKIPSLLLTGKTKQGDRQKMIAKFQAGDEKKVFLLSLKAGGTGLNLTAASYVIHYDPWWNPAVEVQATDRAHRIGQKRSVNVYKFLVKGTVEEKILSLQEKKKGLIDDLITGSSGSKRLTKKDLEFLFE